MAESSGEEEKTEISLQDETDKMYGSAAKFSMKGMAQKKKEIHYNTESDSSEESQIQQLEFGSSILDRDKDDEEDDVELFIEVKNRRLSYFSIISKCFWGVWCCCHKVHVCSLKYSCCVFLLLITGIISGALFATFYLLEINHYEKSLVDLEGILASNFDQRVSNVNTIISTSTTLMESTNHATYYISVLPEFNHVKLSSLATVIALPQNCESLEFLSILNAVFGNVSSSVTSTDVSSLNDTFSNLDKSEENYLVFHSISINGADVDTIGTPVSDPELLQLLGRLPLDETKYFFSKPHDDQIFLEIYHFFNISETFEIYGYLKASIDLKSHIFDEMFGENFKYKFVAKNDIENGEPLELSEHQEISLPHPSHTFEANLGSNTVIEVSYSATHFYRSPYESLKYVMLFLPFLLLTLCLCSISSCLRQTRILSLRVCNCCQLVICCRCLSKKKKGPKSGFVDRNLEEEVKKNKEFVKKAVDSLISLNFDTDVMKELLGDRRRRKKKEDYENESIEESIFVMADMMKRMKKFLPRTLRKQLETKSLEDRIGSSSRNNSKKNLKRKNRSRKNSGRSNGGGGDTKSNPGSGKNILPRKGSTLGQSIMKKVKKGLNFRASDAYDDDDEDRRDSFGSSASSNSTNSSVGSSTSNTSNCSDYTHGDELSSQSQQQTDPLERSESNSSLLSVESFCSFSSFSSLMSSRSPTNYGKQVSLILGDVALRKTVTMCVSVSNLDSLFLKYRKYNKLGEFRQLFIDFITTVYNVVKANRGDFHHFEGSKILFSWGAVSTHNSEAGYGTPIDKGANIERNACYAAMGITNHKFFKKYKMTVRIGIVGGECICGNFDLDEIDVTQFGILGRNVNYIDHLTQLNVDHGSGIIIDQGIYNVVKFFSEAVCVDYLQFGEFSYFHSCKPQKVYALLHTEKVQSCSDEWFYEIGNSLDREKHMESVVYRTVDSVWDMLIEGNALAAYDSMKKYVENHPEDEVHFKPFMKRCQNVMQGGKVEKRVFL